MKMELKSGRNFSREFPSDFARDTTGNFLVNEEVVKIMGVDDAVGKNFSFMGISGRIVGILKNFHFKGADQPIEPGTRLDSRHGGRRFTSRGSSGFGP